MGEMNILVLPPLYLTSLPLPTHSAKAVPVAGKENVYKVSLVALPSREVFLTTDASGWCSVCVVV